MKTPSGLDVSVDRGTIFKTKKGTYIIWLVDEANKSVHFTPIEKTQHMTLTELQKLVKDGRVKL